MNFTRGDYKFIYVGLLFVEGSIFKNGLYGKTVINLNHTEREEILGAHISEFGLFQKLTIWKDPLIGECPAYPTRIYSVRPFDVYVPDGVGKVSYKYFF